MALKIEELFTSASRGARARVTPDTRGLYVATFAADALIELLIAGCAVAFNESTNKWVPYTQPSDAAIHTLTSDANADGTARVAGTPQVDVITANATPASGGTFDISINGHDATLAFDPTGAEMQTQLRAMLLAEYGADAVACVSSVDVDLGDASAVITLTFVETMGIVDMQIDTHDLTGNAHVLSQTTLGVDPVAAVAAASGTFDLELNGYRTEVPYNVTAAALQVLLRARFGADGSDLPGGGTIACVATTGANLGVNSAVITITWPELMGAPVVAIDTDDMGGGLIVLAATGAGTALDRTDKIRGFVFEDSIQIDASDDVLGVIMVKGEVERDDANTSAVRALLRGSPSEAELDVALGAPKLKDAGIMVRGLSTVH